VRVVLGQVSACVSVLRRVLGSVGDRGTCVPAPHAKGGLGDQLFSVLYVCGYLLLRWELVYVSNMALGLERRGLVLD